MIEELFLFLFHFIHFHVKDLNNFFCILNIFKLFLDNQKIKHELNLVAFLLYLHDVPDTFLMVLIDHLR